MDAKITLNLDKYVIEKAKLYATSHNRSLSRIIESYLQALTIHEDAISLDEIQISSFVKSMSSGVHIPADLDFKTEYSDFLTEKYK